MRLPEWVRRLFTFQPSTNGSAYYPGWISALLAEVAAAEQAPPPPAEKPRIRVKARTEHVVYGSDGLRVGTIFEGDEVIGVRFGDLAPMMYPRFDDKFEMFCQG